MKKKPEESRVWRVKKTSESEVYGMVNEVLRLYWSVFVIFIIYIRAIIIS